jgi:catechol 2,3-dioxygenase-like lactoylglutathione lyase family enzyme
MAEFPAPKEGIVLTHFIVSDDVERSRRFYTEVLGGETVREGEPSFVALANGWIIINVGGGPTDDKPTVTLETPPDTDRVSSFLNIRVADIEAVYADWSARGAEFLTPPRDRAAEIRCYLRDPDGHLIEVGQTSPRFWSNRPTRDVRGSRRLSPIAIVSRVGDDARIWSRAGVGSGLGGDARLSKEQRRGGPRRASAAAQIRP